jgi:hypothetical protein
VLSWLRGGRPGWLPVRGFPHCPIRLRRTRERQGDVACGRIEEQHFLEAMSGVQADAVGGVGKPTKTLRCFVSGAVQFAIQAAAAPLLVGFEMTKRARDVGRVCGSVWGSSWACGADPCSGLGRAGWWNTPFGPLAEWLQVRYRVAMKSPSDKSSSLQGSNLTPEQCRMARAALNIGVRELAAAAVVSTNTITRLERGETLYPRTVAAVRAVLEAAGVEFTNGDAPGVRMNRKTE